MVTGHGGLLEEQVVVLGSADGELGLELTLAPVGKDQAGPRGHG